MGNSQDTSDFDKELSFGQWMKLQRKRYDLRQDDLAFRVNCSYEMVRKIESGRRRPSRELAELLAKELGSSQDELATLIELARFPAQYEERDVREPTGERISGRAEAHLDPTTAAAFGSGRRNGLPMPLTGFIGRAAQIETLVKILGEKEVRILTLVGPPGVGKTRLSIEVAHRLAPQFKDGVFFVPLSSVSHSEMVLPAIAASVGINVPPGDKAIQAVAEGLYARDVLILLDNFEQLVGAGAVVGELVALCPRLRVIVTSRTSLSIYGERRYVVPPLEVPELEGPLNLEMLFANEAVTLFVKRAEAIHPDFLVTSATAEVVAHICLQLDGLPLAIELAAACSRFLSPEEILGRLNSRLSLLTRGAAGLPIRQSTMRGAIEWSHDLLSEPERALFRRMSVFEGGATLMAIEEICTLVSEPEFDAAELIASLLDKSLIHREETARRDVLLPEVTGVTRYSMLRTIREFSHERLVQSGEASLIEKERALYFMELAEHAEGRLTSRERGTWLWKLEVEKENLRAAMTWCLSPSGDVEVGLRIASALGWYWQFRGNLAEGSRWIEEMLDRPGAAAHERISAKSRGVAGRLAFLQLDREGARRYLDKAVTDNRRVGAARDLAYSLAFLGIVAAQSGEVAGRDYLSESIGLLEELNDLWGLAYVLDYMAAVEYWLGNTEGAARRYAESLALYRQLNSRWDVAHELSALGHLAVSKGDYVAARVWLEEALEIEQEVGDRLDVAQSLRALGEAAQCQMDYERAEALYVQSLALYRLLGDQSRSAALTRNLGHVALRQGDRRRADVLYKESLASYQQQRQRWGIALALAALAGLMRTGGQIERAATLLAAVEATRMAEHQAMAPADLAEYKANVAAAREALGDGAFDAASSKGHAMALEQATAFIFMEPLPVSA